MQESITGLDGWYGRTSQAPSQALTGETSDESSMNWQTWGRWSSSGECWMLRTSESLKDDDESSLSLASILEPASESLVPYYLSQKAAQGILRRADVRGKTLPERLRKALEKVSHGGTAETRPTL